MYRQKPTGYCIHLTASCTSNFGHVRRQGSDLFTLQLTLSPYSISDRVCRQSAPPLVEAMQELGRVLWDDDRRWLLLLLLGWPPFPDLLLQESPALSAAACKAWQTSSSCDRHHSMASVLSWMPHICKSIRKGACSAFQHAECHPHSMSGSGIVLDTSLFTWRRGGDSILRPPQYVALQPVELAAGLALALHVHPLACSMCCQWRC